jgi:putative cell wall-binding protein
MKAKQLLILVAPVVLLVFALTGCSQNQQEIFDAAMKMQNVNSMQEHTTMTFQLSGSGFEPDSQKQLDEAARLVNNTKVDLDAKINCNKQKTLIKSQVDMKLDYEGTVINLPYWVNLDYTGSTPKFLEIFKLPLVAKASLPPLLASKEYMVMNLYEMNNSELEKMNMINMMYFLKVYQEKSSDFLTDYAQRFNPAFHVVDNGIQDVQTNDGLKQARIYTIKINDRQLKEFIHYSVNNFLQDKETIKFIKDLMYSMLEHSQVPDKEIILANFDEGFNEFETVIPQFLEQFNLGMDQLKDVEFLGEKGLEIQYAISDGYLVQESMAIDLKLDMGQIGQFMNILNEQQGPSEDLKGTLNLMINLNTDISHINTLQDIKIPEVTNDNSFTLTDLMNFFTTTRLSGEDRYQTAIEISKQFNPGTIPHVIIASGNNFPDALSANVLATKLKAPLLLVDSRVESSNETMNYISQHLSKTGTVYILGGTELIGTEFETQLNEMGFNNLERIGGNDRYDTNILIAQKLNVLKNTPIIIASGENFPDALSISSIAGNKGYPVLLVSKDNMTQAVKNFITNDQPSQIYLMGGTGAVSETIKSEIQALVPNCPVTRLAGQDRFDTTGQILNMFSLDPKTIYIASGNNYPDALAGSVLAAVTGDPILLIDPDSPNLPPATEAYLHKLYELNIHPTVISFGGSVAVPDAVIDKVKGILYGSL